MSDLIKRMNATLAMGVIAPRSSAHEYTIAESQFREAADKIERLTALVALQKKDMKQAMDDNQRLQARVKTLEGENKILVQLVQKAIQRETLTNEELLEMSEGIFPAATEQGESDVLPR